MFDGRDLFLLADCPEAEKSRLLADCPPLEVFEKGAVIYAPDRYVRALGVFLSGEGAALSGQTVKRTFAEGDLFGAAALFGGDSTYISTIVARTECRIQFIPESVLAGWMEKHPAMAMRYIAFLSEKLRFLNRRIAQYTDTDAAARLYRFLCDNADRAGCLSVKNMSLLASETGMGRTSLYRALAQLEEEQKIRRDKDAVTVL